MLMGEFIAKWVVHLVLDQATRVHNQPVDYRFELRCLITESHPPSIVIWGDKFSHEEFRHIMYGVCWRRLRIPCWDGVRSWLFSQTSLCHSYSDLKTCLRPTWSLGTNWWHSYCVTVDLTERYLCGGGDGELYHRDEHYLYNRDTSYPVYHLFRSGKDILVPIMGRGARPSYLMNLLSPRLVGAVGGRKYVQSSFSQWTVTARHSGQLLLGTVGSHCSAQWAVTARHSGQSLLGTVGSPCSTQLRSWT